MRIVFFGSSKFVIPIIEVLQRNFDLKLVLTTERLAFQGDALEAPVIDYCVKNKISYLSASSLSDQKVKSQLLNVNCQIAALADFGLIIPQSILNMFSMGIINIHPSLLPKYRGPTPVQATILNGDKQSGVSIMKLDYKVDHGPLLAQVKEPIFENDTGQTLYERLFKKGAELLPKVLGEYLDGEMKLIVQDDSKATFTKRLSRTDGFIDLNKPPSPEVLERKIRAYFPWPGVWTRLSLGFGGQAKIKIVKFLPGEKIQVEGKKPVSYKDFLNGYPNLPPVMLNLFQHLGSLGL